MKTLENNRFVTNVGELKPVEFTVQRHNMRHLMSILRDQLYSDKKLAPIREYSCNAYDANVENGKKDVPIKVTLPTTFFPELKIRDYGKGLSYEEMVGIFCSYGESTKRNSNEFIGQLGIGSKSGFAYGDNFLVTSYNNGVKSTYNCALDSSGVGTLIHFATENTQEESGLEITIPVRSSDIFDFKTKALNFFKFWDVYPNIVGINKEEVERTKFAAVPMLQGEGWTLYEPNENEYGHVAHVIMGNISYPLVWDLVYDYNTRSSNSFYNFLAQSKIIFRMPIGSIEMSPSRESLQYTEHTIKSIKAKVDEIISSMRETINKKIADAKNIWEAKLFYGQMFGKIHGNAQNYNLSKAHCKLEECFKNQLKWNDIIINKHTFDNLHVYDSVRGNISNGTVARSSPNLPTEQAYSIYNISRKGTLKCNNTSYTANTMYVSPTNVVVLNDILDKKGINRNAIKHYLQENNKINNLYFLNFRTPDAQKSFFTEQHFDDVPTLKMSDLVAAFLKNKPKIQRLKVPKELVRIGYVNLPTYYRTSDFATYETIDMNQTSGIYVYTENRIVDFNGTKLPLAYFLEHLKTINLSFKMGLDKLYFIGTRIKNSKKFNEKNWTNVFDLIKNVVVQKKCIDNWIQHTAYVNTINNIRNNRLNAKSLIMSKSIMTSIIGKIKNNNGVFYKIYNAYPDIDFTQDTNVVRAITNMGLLTHSLHEQKLKDSEKVYSTIFESLYSHYKMLKFINIDMGKHDGKLDSLQANLADEIAEYINIMDHK